MALVNSFNHRPHVRTPVSSGSTNTFKVTESSDLFDREIMSQSTKEGEVNTKCGESALACEKASGLSVGRLSLPIVFDTYSPSFPVLNL